MTLTPNDNTPGRKPVVSRPVVSDSDGTREGGLIFCISLIAGMITAAVLAPSALTSFWVWLGLLAMAVGLAVNAQILIARLGGMAGADDEDGAS